MSSDNRRAHPRVSTSLEAKVKLPDGRTVKTGQILNISLGGVFIEIDDPPAFGSELEIEFALPSAKIHCEGLVVWSTKSAPQMARGKNGVGLRLMKIGVSEMRQLADFIKIKLDTPK